MTTDDFNFAHWLEELGHGSTNKQASEQLAALTQACRETGKAGTLVLTLKVGASDHLAEIKPSIKTTMPQPALPGGSYFVTTHGALVTEDPRQASLPLKTLGVTPIRNPNGDAS